MSYNDRHFWSSAEQTLNGATDLELPFAALEPILIHKIGLRVTNTAAGGAAVTFERRRNVSTDTTIEVVTIPASDNDGLLLYTDDFTPVEFLPGDVLNLAVVEGGTAPTAFAVIEYSHRDAELENVAVTIAVESA